MNQEYTTLKKTIIAATSWQDKYRHIMLFGKMLPTLPDALKVDSAKVSGCESNVWLYLELNESDNTLVVVADSDTRIVKGLVAIILHCFNGLTPIEAEQIDIASEFTQMDLIKHLSPSRGNGIKAIANEITQFIARYN
ncbi:SufE family protein [Pseudoalteromonas ulvae]|uniref:SufE protein n=1 Tax=Pseudoalteromonas ulvae TaxID=107327 RepID=A0A244CMH1_PSEDV|nr:SufE family protein [Pseudoalteromonas ulvae]OUL56706.1 SufE protein [Pseudoalteromonas ulvae]